MLSNLDIVKDDTKAKVLLDTDSQTSVARADLVAKEKWDPESKIAVRCIIPLTAHDSCTSWNKQFRRQFEFCIDSRDASVDWSE